MTSLNVSTFFFCLTMKRNVMTERMFARRRRPTVRQACSSCNGAASGGVTRSSASAFPWPRLAGGATIVSLRAGPGRPYRRPFPVTGSDPTPALRVRRQRRLEAMLHEDPQRDEAIAPPDLLPFLVGASVVADGHLVDAVVTL